MNMTNSCQKGKFQHKQITVFALHVRTLVHSNTGTRANSVEPDQGLHCLSHFNTELNNLGINHLLRKSDVIVERISVCNANEKLMEHGMHYLPCSYTSDVIDLLR